ncbi:NAD(P)H-dependent oxidoreductase subunit E [Colwellia sp. MB3u-70]|uniref:NAD(P)H-dependent oxidoreductase subunit E n=1 Tax=unclassified Colwellia TaxID=196834 RepID=UPI0015F366F5|nr:MULTISPECIES: NAD(P)H-dependent oxidoreductase subunit E [unclassified Colwellia]MBA6293539.1 NAD(P)H-dependent oxidoreductase subunit E [Colwellia sp. MB3u-8]MBA6306061.1 NAD(P)H-dependent oxidoreductase subunit E [Colwellia sp. MB3u-70]
MKIEFSSPLSNVENIIDSLKNKEGSLLPILHAIQREMGYISSQAIERIATKLKQTPAEIHGVISFYHQFRTSPPSKYQIQICRAEACQSRGSRQLEAHAKDFLAIDYHQMTRDKKFSLDSVYCLGNCATGPNIRINDDLYGRISNDRFEEILSNLDHESK